MTESGKNTANPAARVFIGIGANLVADGFRSPRETCMAAIARLGEAEGVAVGRISPWYKTAPVPVSDQPWFRNAVFEVETGLDPAALLSALHECEAHFGRVRGRKNAARVLDLDILDFGGMVQDTGSPPILPHPRLHERAFVLYPLADLAPRWRHPVLGKGVGQLIAELPPGQEILPDSGAD